MEIGLYAESAGLSSLAKTLPRARDLGITRSKLSTGGQNPDRRLDVFELHLVNLVYNVSTLLMMREAVGETIGVDVDPSHLMWQWFDIPACVRHRALDLPRPCQGRDDASAQSGAGGRARQPARRHVSGEAVELLHTGVRA